MRVSARILASKRLVRRNAINIKVTRCLLASEIAKGIITA